MYSHRTNRFNVTCVYDGTISNCAIAEVVEAMRCDPFDDLDNEVRSSLSMIEIKDEVLIVAFL